MTYCLSDFLMNFQTCTFFTSSYFFKFVRARAGAASLQSAPLLVLGYLKRTTRFLSCQGLAQASFDSSRCAMGCACSKKDADVKVPAPGKPGGRRDSTGSGVLATGVPLPPGTIPCKSRRAAGQAERSSQVKFRHRFIKIYAKDDEIDF